MCTGICNYCGGHANKRERAQGWAQVHIGLTVLQMHHHCAEEYHLEGLLPNSTFRRRSDSLAERISRAMESSPKLGRRRYPEGKLWFGAPVEGRPLNFN